MKKFLIVFVFGALTLSISAQKDEVYNTNANAKADIAKAVAKAKINGKHVFLQIGGNWCPWCIKFHRFLKADTELNSFVIKNYEVVKVNYDTDNKQEELLKELGFPQRFGFPVFVVLDGNGNRIHTQNSAFLEKDKSYDRVKVLRFLKNWSANSINPNTYIN